jgi:hydroxyethylthiazole kinase
MSRVTTRASLTHAQMSAELLDRLREEHPLVQCITNAVVTNFTANALLALGAAAAMCDLPGEAGPFARVASGLLINLGTPHAEQRDGMREAALAATEAGTPWVLDPVAIGMLPVRTALAQELLALRPPIIRGNPSEIIALNGAGTGGRGVDSTDSVEGALAAARSLAHRFGSIVAVSGPIDLVTDGVTDVRLGNGHELLTRVTGGGCALGAVIAAFASLASTSLAATSLAYSEVTLRDTTVVACAVYTVAADLAAARSAGPGSFSVEFVDALASITGADLVQRMVSA